MYGTISQWLTKYKIEHRPLGFDYQGVETVQIKSQNWSSVAVALYLYGFNYLRLQLAYDLSPGGKLVSVYYLTKMRDQADQPQEICIKVLVSRLNPKLASVFWIWKTANFQERESYDMLGIIYESHPSLKRILMPESWLGWPMRKDYITPNFYELQDAF
uniref:NAD(P)H-quinone oxidoreductase n=1 Tax=Nitella hyalina TaxID=181804 RepID=A0A2H4G3D3_NITHY|nr:NADH dehydrogenase subunit J [Nitella hyalina]